MYNMKMTEAEYNMKITKAEQEFMDSRRKYKEAIDKLESTSNELEAKNGQAIYMIPVTFKMHDTITVYAHSFSEAVDKLYDRELPLGELVDESFTVEESNIRIQGYISDDYTKTNMTMRQAQTQLLKAQQRYEEAIKELNRTQNELQAERGQAIYTIPVTFQRYGTMTVLSHSLSEAIDKVHERELPLGEFVDESFTVNPDNQNPNTLIEGYVFEK